MLVALLMAFLLGGGGAGGAILTAETVKQLGKEIQAEVSDPARAEDAAEAGDEFKVEIKGFEKGLNNSPEGLNKGFKHCYMITFDSEKGRDVYLVHPDHKKFVELVGPVLEDVFVVDYWAGK